MSPVPPSDSLELPAHGERCPNCGTTFVLIVLRPDETSIPVDDPLLGAICTVCSVILHITADGTRRADETVARKWIAEQIQQDLVDGNPPPCCQRKLTQVGDRWFELHEHTCSLADY